MAYTPIYTRKNFVNNSAPAISATNLNDIEDALVSLENGLQTAAADTDTNTAAITTINGEISDLNNLIDEILPDDSESGNPAVITDAFGGECKSLVLTLEPIQSGSGTPSPQNVRPIAGRTQSTAIRTGKNVLVYPNAATSRTENGVTFTANPDGTITLNGTATQNFNYYLASQSTPDIRDVLLNAGEIKIAGGISASSAYVNLWNYDGAGSSIASAGAPSNPFIFSNTSASWNLVIQIRGGAVFNNVKMEIMIVSSSVNDYTYEPYVTPESITRPYGQTIFGGSDDTAGDGVTVTYGYAELDGSDDEGWLIVDSNRRAKSMYLAALIERTTDPNKVADIVCSQYPAVTLNQTYLGTAGIAGGASDGTIYIADGSGSMDLATFKASLSANPVQVAFKLETYTSLPLSSQNIPLLKGDNIITTDADNVDVEYKADIALYIAKQLGGNLGNRGAKSAPAEEPADDTKEEEKTDEKIIEPVTKEAEK